jgi:PIN domain nuclease of toxin-antitoxin system
MGGGALILLDTHIWVWWVNGDSRLSSAQQQLLQANESTGLAISIISCWEVAKKVERQKLVLDRPIKEWIDRLGVSWDLSAWYDPFNCG